MLVILIVLLVAILISAYYTFHKELCSPAVLFVAPFVVMCIIALINANTWSFELHSNTFAIILFGNLFFCFGTYVGNKIKLKNLGKNCDISQKQEISSWKYIFLLVFQIVCYAIKLKYIMDYAVSHGVARDLSQCLVYYNDMQKFTTEETVNFPSWLSLSLDACAVFGFICACLLAQQALLKQRNQRELFLLLANFGVAVLGGMSSGGRGGSVQVLLAFLCVYIILYQRKYEWEKGVSLKTLFIVGVGLCSIGLIFIISMTWVGRTAAQNIGRYISNYIGAQIYNLDYFLNEAFTRSEIWGQETFYPLIQRLAGWFDISKWENFHVGYQNVTAAGYNTGNVYTAFYSYVKDFGAFGVVIIPSIFGILSQIVYRYARKAPQANAINIGLIIYSIFAYCIVFSFFADKFGSLLLTFNMLKRLLLLGVLYIFLFKIEIVNSKIIIHTDFFKKFGLAQSRL